MLIWDEPLNYMDIETRQQLLDLILATQPTLLLVEHDAYFTDAVATSTLALNSM